MLVVAIAALAMGRDEWGHWTLLVDNEVLSTIPAGQWQSGD
jgi:hypothetical protein